MKTSTIVKLSTTEGLGTCEFRCPHLLTVFVDESCTKLQNPVLVMPDWIGQFLTRKKHRLLLMNFGNNSRPYLGAFLAACRTQRPQAIDTAYLGIACVIMVHIGDLQCPIISKRANSLAFHAHWADFGRSSAIRFRFQAKQTSAHLPLALFSPS